MRSTWWMLLAMGCTGPATSDTPALDQSPDTTDQTDTTRESTATTADTGTTVVDCSTGPAESGPWAGHPLADSGATITADDYKNDAGLAVVRKAALAVSKPTKVSLPVTNATVIAKGYVPAAGTFAKFWIADSSGPLVAFNVDVPDAPGLAPGDVVSFTATSVDNFFDLPQIQSVSDFTVAKAQGEVQVIDALTIPLDYALHGERVVEAWGGIVRDNGPCGGDSNCYDIEVGKQTYVYRTESTFTRVGDCVHFIGPLQRFQTTLQLTVEDFDWARDF